MWALVKYDWKNNWLLLLIFTLVLSFYLSVIIYMYDQASMAATESVMEMMPSDMVEAFGFTGISNDLTGFIAGYYYGFLIFIFPMIFCIIAGNRLVAKHVDSGAMAYLLQTSWSRTSIALTQGLFLWGNVMVIFLLTYIVGVSVCQTLFPGLLNVAALAKLHFSAFMLTSVIAMICFYYSCCFSETKNSLALGAGVPITMLLMLMLGEISEQISWVKQLSLYSLLDAPTIVQNGDTLGINLAFGFASVVLLMMGVRVFSRKQLSL